MKSVDAKTYGILQGMGLCGYGLSQVRTYRDVWKLHGLLLKWVHDQGSVFISDFMLETQLTPRDRNCSLDGLPPAD